MNKELENIELRSEEVQEILGHIPNRIIRYGITITLLVVLLLFTGSFFFKYPDIILAQAEVVTKNPPAEITTNVSGLLSDVFIVDSQLVTTGQCLAIIKNPANYEHMNYVYQHMTQIETVLENADLYLHLPDTFQLGSVQSAYSSLIKAAQAYYQFVELDYHAKKLASLKIKQQELSKYAQIMNGQAMLHAADYSLSQNQYSRDSQLYQKEVISMASLEKSKKGLIQEGMAVQSAKSVVVTTQIELNELQQQILELQMEHVEQINTHLRILHELYQNLENKMVSWYDQYVLVSPIDGTVALNTVWSSNQFVDAGSQVFTVIPNQKLEVIGRVILESRGAGKVKPGQFVNIKFNNYPYQEFGMVQAVVSSISQVPVKNQYSVELSLPDSLVTNYGIALPFSQRMAGTAEIITEDLPLIARIFNPLKAILKKHWAH